MAAVPAAPPALPPFTATRAAFALSRPSSGPNLLHLLGEALRELGIEPPCPREVRSSQWLRGRWLDGGWSPVRSCWQLYFGLYRGRLHRAVPRCRRTCFLRSDPEEHPNDHQLERHAILQTPQRDWTTGHPKG